MLRRENLEADSWPTNLTPNSPPTTRTALCRASRLPGPETTPASMRGRPSRVRLLPTVMTVHKTSRGPPPRTNQPTPKPADMSAARTPTVGRPPSPASAICRIQGHDRTAPAQTVRPTKRPREAIGRRGQPRPPYHQPGQAGVPMPLPLPPPGPRTYPAVAAGARTPTPHRLPEDRQDTPPRVGPLSNGLLRHSRRTHDLHLHLRPGIHPRRRTQPPSSAAFNPTATISTATRSTASSPIPPLSPIKPVEQTSQACAQLLTTRGTSPQGRELPHSDPIPSPAHRPVGRLARCLPWRRQLSSGSSHLAPSRAGSPPASKVRPNSSTPPLPS